MKRVYREEAEIKYSFADICLFTGSQMVKCADKKVDLTAAEYKILLVFMKNIGQILSREQLIALLSIIINTAILSFLSNQNFTKYLDDNYEQTCLDIQYYLENEMQSEHLNKEQVLLNLSSFLEASITKIDVYDDSGALLFSVSDNQQINKYNSMHGMMRAIMNEGNDGYNIQEEFLMENGKGLFVVTRFTSSADSYAATMFQNSLLRNSLFSLSIVLVVVLVLGVWMSRKVSRELVKTADYAQNIELGKEEIIHYSKTKEIFSIQKSLTALESRLKIRQKARKTLIDEMVHQTRTPLSILKMHIEGIEDGIIHMQEKELQVCNEQILQLTHIIENMSGFLDAEMSEQRLQISSIEMNHFFEQIMNGMRTQFQKKSIDFRLLSNEKWNLKTDPYLLGQSIYNLLTNAYKFTATGGTVLIDYKYFDSMAQIDVRDSGCGIPTQEQAHIFEAYYKKERKDGPSGDGLGLFIVKENLKRLGGSAYLVDSDSMGSTFRLELPIHFIEIEKSV